MVFHIAGFNQAARGPSLVSKWAARLSLSSADLWTRKIGKWQIAASNGKNPIDQYGHMVNDKNTQQLLYQLCVIRVSYVFHTYMLPIYIYVKYYIIWWLYILLIYVIYIYVIYIWGCVKIRVWIGPRWSRRMDRSGSSAFWYGSGVWIGLWVQGMDRGFTFWLAAIYYIYTWCFSNWSTDPLKSPWISLLAVASVVPDARKCVGVCFVASRRLAEIPLGKTNRIETININMVNGY